MHDKPGVIIVNLNQPPDVLKQQLDDAFAQATFVFNTPIIAVFKHGYDS